MALERSGGVQSDVHGGTTPLPRASLYGESTAVERQLEVNRGLDTIVRNLRAANAEMDRTIKDYATVRQRSAVYGYGAAAGAAVSYANTQGNGLPPGHPAAIPERPSPPVTDAQWAPPAPLAPPAAPTSPPPQAGAVVPSRPRPRRAEGRAGPDDNGVEPYSPSQIFEEGRNYRVQNLYGDIGHFIQRRAQAIPTGPPLVQDTQGNYVLAPGQPDAGRAATPAEVATHRRKQGVVSWMQNLGGKLGKATSGGDALESVLGSFEGVEGMAGVAGLAGAGLTTAGVGLAGYGLLKGAGAFVQGQRRNTAQYQQIYGGGGGLFSGNEFRSVTDKISDTITSLNPFSDAYGMSGGQLEQLRQGVGSLGFRGGAQGNARNFGIQNFQRYGMGVDDSLQILQTAIESGNKGLVGLADTLKLVAKNAQDTGQAVGEQQKRFSDTYKSLTQTLTGTAATTVAGGLTSAATSAGLKFKGVNYGGLLSTTQGVNILSSRLGMGPGQLIAGIQEDPTLAGRAVSAQVQSTLVAELRAQVPQLDEIIDGYMSKNGIKSRGTLSNDDIDNISTELFGAGAYPEALVIAARQDGIDVKAADVIGVALQFYLDPNFLARHIRQAVGTTQGGVSKGAGTVPGAKGGLTNKQLARTSGFKREAASLGVSDPSFLGKKITAEGTPLSRDNPGGPSADDAGSAYLKQWRSTGVHSPIVEKLLADPNSKDLRFAVKNKAGKQVVVDLMTAISSYYDQLVSGAATEVAGPSAGQSVAEATGGAAASKDPKVAAAAARAKATEQNVKQGTAPQSMKEWQKENPRVSAGGIQVHSRVTLSMTPEASKVWRQVQKFATGDLGSVPYTVTPPDRPLDPAQRKDG